MEWARWLVQCTQSWLMMPSTEIQAALEVLITLAQKKPTEEYVCSENLELLLVN